MPAKILIKIFCISLSFLLAIPPAAFGQRPEYRVGPGDVLELSIAVQGSPGDLSRLSGNIPIRIIGERVFFTIEVLVGPDGKISVPDIEDPIHVQSKTLREIGKEIRNGLKLPKHKKSVFVSLLKPNSKSYFVWGEVNHPGRYVFERPITFIEALSNAGGPGSRAKLKNVLLLKSDGSSTRINLLTSSIKENGISNIQIEPSDTIIVPKKWSSDLGIGFFVLTLIGTLATVSIAAKD